MTTPPLIIKDVEACVDYILETVGKEIRLGLPLGLGKPPQLVNAIYRRAKADPTIKLTILTALSLEVPSAGKGLQKALMAPIFKRVFGNYPGLDYMHDIHAGTVPANIDVHEFFFKSGSMLGNSYAQQRYISTNYTHAPRDILNYHTNVVCQLVAHRKMNGQDQYSLSCNPEVSLDLLGGLEARKANGEKILILGQVQDDLPFMVNDAQVNPDHFDALLVNPEYSTTLFAPPNQPVSTIDYMIGLHTSALIRDGGTLQIGIGSLGDAIVYGCELRHTDNASYKAILKELEIPHKFGPILERVGGTGTFERGLYGASEMFVSGFYQLIKAGILRKKVYEDLRLQKIVRKHRWTDEVNPTLFKYLLEEKSIHEQLTEDDVEFLVKYGIFRAGTHWDHGELVAHNGQRMGVDLRDAPLYQRILSECLGTRLLHGRIMHGGFFVGNRAFYDGLRDMSEEQRAQINMTAISYVNALYGNEELKRAQREDARFINTVFLVHLLGAATSDGLDNGKVVSGVGGQYNFVAQAHELQGARSILMLKSTRSKGSETQSNIVFKYGHITIPRHLRDIYVTEYGIADVRGKSDQEVIAALLNIADSRFQPELLKQAKAAGKIDKAYEIPELFRNNTPDRLEAIAAKYHAKGLFPAFPAGCDLLPDELRIARALKVVAKRAESKTELAKALWKMRSDKPVSAEIKPLLERIGLTQPTDIKDKIARQLLIEELSK